jgi:integrase
VLRVIEPIWKTKTATASRLRGRIESILDWAKARGYRSGDNTRWSEIDLKERVWTVPGGRMKGGAEHKVMLAPEVIELLKQLPRDGDGDGYLFIGSRSGTGLNSKSLHRALARMKVDAVPHGFRSSFSDWAHECTTHSNHSIEISLAHKVGNDVEQAYRRGPMIAKRMKLMADWARFCCTPPSAISDNVVALAAR